jgi:hypothetical protein
VLDVATRCVRAQREIDAKTSEIPELAPAITHLDLIGQVVTLDALCGRPHNASYAGTFVMPMPPPGAVSAVAPVRTAAA